MSRIAATFDRLRADGRKGLVAYITAGDPDAARSRDVAHGVARGGADVIELGVPFSDPIADGPVIQRASERSLAAGGGLQPTLDLVADLRRDCDVPIVLFTYVNPVLRYGVDRFVDRAAGAGVDGVLLLDLPIEEAADTRRALDRRGLDQIFLLSPTTTDRLWPIFCRHPLRGYPAFALRPPRRPPPRLPMSTSRQRRTAGAAVVVPAR